MITQIDISNFILACEENLDLKECKLGEEFSYLHLPLCVIDSVFSIGIKYASVKNVVDRYCIHVGINDVFGVYNDDKHENIVQHSIIDMINIIEQNGISYFTENIINDRHRTSATNGILKSEAVLQFAKVLKTFGVDTFYDIHLAIGNKNFEKEIKQIKGQGSGLSLIYFYILCGNHNFVKADRQIQRFVKYSIDKKIPSDEIQALFEEATKQLKISYPNLTVSLLDNAIWKLMSANTLKTRTDEKDCSIRNKSKKIILN